MKPGNDVRQFKRWLTVCGVIMLLSLWLSGVLEAAPQSTAQTPTCRELVINGGFEEGGAGWSQSSAGGYSLISNFYPRTGNLAAYLGGTHQADDRLSQQINIPTGAISATLTFWWAISTEEPGIGFDRMAVALYGPDDSLLRDLITIDSSAAENVWDQASFDLTNYGGEAVVLRFHATTDASNLTDFYLDDVSLIVCLPPATIYLPLVWR